MNVTVRLFAHLRTTAGTGEVPVTLAPGATAADAARAVSDRFPGLDVRGSMVAVNARYATGNTQLSDGDVVAVLPPVSGG
jgi:molybdopterin synthase sulfur carrier subunit